MAFMLKPDHCSHSPLQQPTLSICPHGPRGGPWQHGGQREATEALRCLPKVADPTAYDQPGTSPAAEALLLPLHAGLTYGENAWEAAATAGGENRSHTLTLPRRNLRLAHVDVYASGHGCEEFWCTPVEPPLHSHSSLVSRRGVLLHCSLRYTNVPDEDFEADSGACAGGTYREVQLYVDGLLAGALYPFPTIYTGGVCPLLWRPLTGIYSFNVPPYRFDITPFLGLLNDGQPHEIAAKVFGQGDTGTWFLDMVLVGSHDSWLKVAPALEDNSATSARVTCLKAQCVASTPRDTASAAQQPQEATCSLLQSALKMRILLFEPIGMTRTSRCCRAGCSSTRSTRPGCACSTLRRPSIWSRPTAARRCASRVCSSRKAAAAPR